MNLCTELLLVPPGSGLWLQCRVTSYLGLHPGLKNFLGFGTFSICLGMSWSANHNNSFNVDVQPSQLAAALVQQTRVGVFLHAQQWSSD